MKQKNLQVEKVGLQWTNVKKKQLTESTSCQTASKLLPVYSKVCFFLFCMFVLIILVDNIFLLADLLCFPLSLKTSERIYCFSLNQLANI